MFPLRYTPLALVLLAVPIGFAVTLYHPIWGGLIVVIAMSLSALGIFDLSQTNSSVLRNYPISARLRFLLETFRPEIRQYFVESDQDETPFSRDQRSLVYRRAKGIDGLRPFGTQLDVEKLGHEWINHSMKPSHLPNQDFRVTIGGAHCKKPYDASVLNISGMSYGALSPTAIEALNKGAAMGGFSHTTGEGSISRFHQASGGDLVWQIGSGYFGCRNPDGSFSEDRFIENANSDQVKMIEVKLSQGAKPGHGGILPGTKVTEAIAEARGVKVGEDCVSPSSHSAFSTPLELCRFMQRLRDLSGGKPIGIKLCVGHPWEWFALAKAFAQTGLSPDFITVDGAEGGTGAAPAEFADHYGAPLREGLMLVHNTLLGLGIRDKTKIIVSGKLISAFDICRMFALGADACNMARGFMFAIGCIQAQACHTGKCPTGVTTQEPGRYRALVVDEKYTRVAQFHANTMHTLKEAIEASGLSHPHDLTPHHLMIRVNSREVRSAASQYQWLEQGELLGDDTTHPAFAKYWSHAKADSFAFAM